MISCLNFPPDPWPLRRYHAINNLCTDLYPLSSQHQSSPTLYRLFSLEINKVTTIPLHFICSFKAKLHFSSIPSVPYSPEPNSFKFSPITFTLLNPRISSQLASYFTYQQHLRLLATSSFLQHFFIWIQGHYTKLISSILKITAPSQSPLLVGDHFPDLKNFKCSTSQP